MKKSTRNHGTPGFSGIFDFAVVWRHLNRSDNARGPFSVIFLHFLQKYRCVPKIGFSADISIDIFIDIFIDILADIFIDISIDIFIDILTDIFIDISIDILLTFSLTF